MRIIAKVLKSNGYNITSGMYAEIKINLKHDFYWKNS